jgi:2-oxoglutarate ferredoxin oxidoreductase subunit alpha
MLDRLKKKFDLGREILPAPVVECMNCAQFGVIAFGSTEPAIQEARHQLEEQGVATDFMRVRAVPFSEPVREFIAAHEEIYVVEMNRDGQLYQLLILEYPEMATRLRSIAYIDGLPLTADFVRNAVLNGSKQHTQVSVSSKAAAQ